MMVVYFIIFADTSVTLVLSFAGLSQSDKGTSFWYSRSCYVLIIAVVLTPTILMKEISQLKPLSFAIFVLTLIFIAIFAACAGIITPSGPNALEVQQETFGDYMAPQGFQGCIEAISVMIVAMHYVLNLFPVYS